MNFFASEHAAKRRKPQKVGGDSKPSPGRLQPSKAGRDFLRNEEQQRNERKPPHNFARGFCAAKLAAILEAPPGIEPGIEVLQTFALPLGYGAIYTTHIWAELLERKTGLEPATSALARRRSTK